MGIAGWVERKQTFRGRSHWGKKSVINVADTAILSCRSAVYGDFLANDFCFFLFFVIDGTHVSAGEALRPRCGGLGGLPWSCKAPPKLRTKLRKALRQTHVYLGNTWSYCNSQVVIDPFKQSSTMPYCCTQWSSCPPMGPSHHIFKLPGT